MIRARCVCCTVRFLLLLSIRMLGNMVIMRIRFRASDFGLVAKINTTIRAKSKQASCAEMVLGSFFFLLV